MTTVKFKSKSGVSIERSEVSLAPEIALADVYAQIDTHKGAIFSSGFDYPGRHSRWEVGYVNPALEFFARDRSFSLKALNEQGTALLSLFEPALKKNSHVESIENKENVISGTLQESPLYIPEEERSKQSSVFSIIRTIRDLLYCSSKDDSMLALSGAFGYDLIHQFEPVKRRLKRSTEQKDCHLYLPLDFIVIDRKKETAARINYSIKTPLGNTNDFSGGGASYSITKGNGTSEIECDNEPEQFANKVKKIIDGTKRGDFFEVVLSQTFTTEVNETPTNIFKRLSKMNPSPYMFLVNFGEEQLVGASPEIYIRVTDKRYETCPISGTVRRGNSALEDYDRSMELLTSNKEESELTMCTDVDRNDMARVCVPGSVKIIGRRQLEFYSHLIHTVDHVEGTLAENYDALDAFQTHMWACTVSGSPKPAAIQAIENLEESPRGWYSGAIGFLSFNGDINTGITLRTATLKNGKATIRAGATLLYDSNPEMEEQETRTKAAAFLATLAKESAPQENSQEKARHFDPPRELEGKKVLLVDYRDSFVHNLAAYIRTLGVEVITLRAGFPLDYLDKIKPDLVFLSPGPGLPDDFSMTTFIGEIVQRKLPLFGVCLGHQGIAQYFGASLEQLPTPKHGKSAVVTHSNSPIFEGLPESFEAGRYHSIYVTPESLSNELKITAETTDSFDSKIRVPMAIEHQNLPIASVQFHPESLMTLKGCAGYRILQNALTTLLSK